MGLFVRNLVDVLKTEGEAFVENVIKSFSCKYNHDVDRYLKEDAILFTAMSSSVTHKEQGNAGLDVFYRKNGFVPFDNRVSEEDGVTYDLMFSFLK